MGRYARTCCLVLLPTIASAAEYTIVDVQSVPLFGDSASAVRQITISPPVKEISCDVLIAGAGMGGIGAALAVARHDRAACVVEETDWIGGQATAGGVSAVEENNFIEIDGGISGYY